MNEYYIYAYLDPRKFEKFTYKNINFINEPFYIGFGKKERIFSHLKSAQRNKHSGFNIICIDKIKSILQEHLLPIIIKINDNISFDDAKKIEIKLISDIGRLDLGTGPLCNLTSGGQGKHNYKLSDETKNKINLFITTGRNKKISDKLLGVKKTKEHIEKMRLNATGKQSFLKGKTFIEIYGKEKANELIINMKNNFSNKTYDERFGVKKSMEIKQKMSNIRKGVKKSEAHKQKLKENLDKQRMLAKLGQKNKMLNRLKIIFELHKNDIIQYFNISENYNRYLALSKKINVDYFSIKQIKKHINELKSM